MGKKKTGRKKKTGKRKPSKKKTGKKARVKKGAAKKSKPGRQDIVAMDGELPLELPDRRGMEGMMSALFGGGADAEDGGAQELMYEAWDTPNPRKRIALAREALAISVDCADAHVLLAEEAATSLDEAISYYRQGVEAGERSLGDELFEEAVGHFWGLLETRPYMRARAGLAQCLWAAGHHDQAIQHYHDMLRLNPNDNQGLRYTLLASLIERARDGDASDLLRQYAEDGTAAWTYSAALLRFRKEGDTAPARELLQEALAGNAHVPGLLLGKKKMPSRLPDYMGFGDENEAVHYVVDNLALWTKTPGALKWLRAGAKA